MVYVGQIVVIDGKPQVVESVNGNSSVSRPATYDDLKNRSLPANLPASQNPNISQAGTSDYSGPLAPVEEPGGKNIMGEVWSGGVKVYTGVVGTERTAYTYSTQPTQPTQPQQDVKMIRNEQGAIIGYEDPNRQVSVYAPPISYNAQGDVSVKVINPYDYSVISTTYKTQEPTPRQSFVLENIPGVTSIYEKAVSPTPPGLTPMEQEKAFIVDFVKGASVGAITFPEGMYETGKSILTKGPIATGQEMITTTYTQLLINPARTLGGIASTYYIGKAMFKGAGKIVEKVSPFEYKVFPSIELQKITGVDDAILGRSLFIEYGRGQVIPIITMVGDFSKADILIGHLPKSESIVKSIAEKNALITPIETEIYKQANPGSDISNIIDVSEGVGYTKPMSTGIKFDTTKIEARNIPPEVLHSLFESAKKYQSPVKINMYMYGSAVSKGLELITDKIGDIDYMASNPEGLTSFSVKNLEKQGLAERFNIKVNPEKPTQILMDNNKIMESHGFDDVDPDMGYGYGKYTGLGQRPYKVIKSSGFNIINPKEQVVRTGSGASSFLMDSEGVIGVRRAKDLPRFMEASRSLVTIEQSQGRTFKNINQLELLEAKYGKGQTVEITNPAYTRATGSSGISSGGVGSSLIGIKISSSPKYSSSSSMSSSSLSSMSSYSSPAYSSSSSVSSSPSLSRSSFSSSSSMPSSSLSSMSSSSSSSSSYSSSSMSSSSSSSSSKSSSSSSLSSMSSPPSYIISSKKKSGEKQMEINKMFSGGFQPKNKVRKHDVLRVSPLQEMVSKALYGKSTTPKPTRAIMRNVTVSVPSKEILSHRNKRYL